MGSRNLLEVANVENSFEVAIARAIAQSRYCVSIVLYITLNKLRIYL